MSKENVLYSIIGVLLGFIVGFFFANSVNQRAASGPRAQAVTEAGGDGRGAPLPMNAVRDQQALRSEAEEAARRARQAPEDFDAQMKAADLYYRAGSFEDALEFLLRANDLRPDDYEVVVALGNVNYDSGRFEAAERWYEAALVKRPDDVNVRTDLGLTFFLRDPPEVERAVAEFRRSLERDPRHELTLQNLTVALTRKGDVAEARTTLARLEKSHPANAALPRLRAEIEKARTTSDAGAGARP